MGQSQQKEVSQTSQGRISNTVQHIGEYEGQFKNELKHGDGKITYPDGFSYDGEWLFYQMLRKNDLKHGQGIYTAADGNLYEGEFQNDLRHGYGIQTYSDNPDSNIDEVYFEGYWKNDEKFQGRSQYENKTTYTGDFLNNKKHGNGILENQFNGLSYDGEWFEDKIHGKGIYIEKNVLKYEGEWKQNKKFGYGKLTYKSGEQYEGYFQDNLYHGQGKLIKDDIIYEGIWNQGELLKSLAQEDKEQQINIENQEQFSQTQQIINQDFEQQVIYNQLDKEIQLIIEQQDQFQQTNNQQQNQFQQTNEVLFQDQFQQTNEIQQQNQFQQTDEITGLQALMQDKTQKSELLDCNIDESLSQQNNKSQMLNINNNILQKLNNDSSELIKSQKNSNLSNIEHNLSIFEQKIQNIEMIDQEVQTIQKQQNIKTQTIINLTEKYQQTDIDYRNHKTQTNKKKKISKDIKNLISQKYLQNLYNNFSNNAKQTYYENILNQSLTQEYQLQQIERQLKNKQNDLIQLQEKFEKYDDLQIEKVQTIEILRASSKNYRDELDKIKIEKTNYVLENKDLVKQNMKIQEINQILYEENNNLTSHQKVLEFQIKENQTYLDEILEDSKEKQKLIDYQKDQIDVQTKEFGRIIEFYRKEYSNAKQIELESNLLYKTQLNKVDLHIQIKNLNLEIKDLKQYQEYRENCFCVEKTKNFNIIQELKQQLLKKNLTQNTPLVDYNNEFYIQNRQLQEKINELQKVIRIQTAEMKKSEVQLKLMQSLQSEKNQQIDYQEKQVFQRIDEAKFQYQGYGKMNFLYLTGKPTEKSCLIKSIKFSGESQGKNSQIIACVYDVKENKMTKDLQLIWNNQIKNQKWEFVLEDGDLLLRMQLINSLLKIFIRSEQDDSHAKISYIHISINYLNE